MADINDPQQPSDLKDQYEIEAMAAKLAPLRAVVGGKNAAPPLKTATRPNFQYVNDAMAALIQRLTETSEKAQDLRQRLTGAVGKGPHETGSVPGVDTSIFDVLAHQTLLLARLVAELDEAVDACAESVK